MHIDILMNSEREPVRAKLTDWGDPEFIWINVLVDDVADPDRYEAIERGDENEDGSIRRDQDGRLWRVAGDYGLGEAAKLRS